MNAFALLLAAVDRHPFLQRGLTSVLGGWRMAMRSDAQFMRAVARLLAVAYPAAGRLLHKYLAGDQRPHRVRCAEVIEPDAGARESLRYNIGQALAAGHAGGAFLLHQWEFDNLATRLALGSLRVDWHVMDGQARYRLTGWYDWSPDERRITQPLHAAAHACTRQGARPFVIKSDTAALALPPRPRGPLIPRDRLYL